MSDREVAQAIGMRFKGLDEQIILALELGNMAEEQEGLLAAALDQKMENLRPFSFSEAVDISTFKRSVAWALAGLAVFVLVMLSQWRTVLWESSQRIVRYSEEFTPPAPFSFVLLNDSLSLEKGESLRIAVRAEGSLVPSEMLLLKGNEKLRMRRSEPQEWLWIIESCQEPFSFRFSADGYQSATYQVELLELPKLRALQYLMKPPAYIGLPIQEGSLTGDIAVPEGSEMGFSVLGDNLDSLWWPRTGDTLIASAGAISYQALGDQVFRLMGASSQGVRELFAPVKINIIPDAHPQLAVHYERDSSLGRVQVSLEYSDDYGISRLERVLKIDDKSYRLALKARANGFYSEVLELDSLGDADNREISLFYRVCDNDAINGSKCSNSEVFRWTKYSKSSLAEKAKNELSDFRSTKEEREQEQALLQEMLSELQEKAKAAKSGDWQDQQKLESLLERLNESLKEQERRRLEMERNLEQLEGSEELKESLKDDEAAQQTLEELVAELEKLKDKLDLNAMKERLDRLQSEQQRQMQQEQRMDKLLEDLLFQRDLLDQVQRLEEMAKELDSVQSGDLKDIQEEFEQSKDKLDELKDKDATLKEEMDSEAYEQAEAQVEEGLQDAASESNSGGDPAESKKKASEGAKKMAQKLRSAFQKREQEALQANMESLRRILSNLEYFSHGVEASAVRMKSLESGDPVFRDLLKQQAVFERSIKVAEDSLLLLAERVPQVKATVFEELDNMYSSLGKATAELQEQSAAKASAYDQRAMSAANALALLLEESLDNMMAMMAQQKEGKQNCEKPGQGKPKPGSEGQQMQEMGEAIGKLPKGKKPGQEGNRGMSLSEQAELLKKQEALRELLQEQGKEKEDGSKPGDMGMGPDLENLEDAILEGDPELIRERFKRLESRMLESERANEERKQKEEREAEEADQTKMRDAAPNGSWELDSERQEEQLLFRPLRFTPFYRNLRL